MSAESVLPVAEDFRVPLRNDRISDCDAVANRAAMLLIDGHDFAHCFEQRSKVNFECGTLLR